MITKIGLDLGYANISFSNIASEVIHEPSVVLIDKKTRKVLSVGNKAGGENVATDEDKMLVRPFKNGLLYSSDLTKATIRHVIRSIGKFDKLRCIVALPSDYVSKQESEIFNMLGELGVDECFSVNPAVAGIIGAGYSPNISAISVNIGASATEIAVLHNGQVVLSTRKDVGGEDFDKAVKQYIFDQGDMNVSLIVARTIKEKLGAVWQGKPSESIDIEGTLSLTGNKVRMSISTEDIVGVFEKPLQSLLMAIAETVKRIPLDYVKEIFENGIVLSGGGAEIFGLDIMMSRVYGIPTILAPSPKDCVAKGISRIHTFMPQRIRTDRKNITTSLAKYYNARKSEKKSGGSRNE